MIREAELLLDRKARDKYLAETNLKKDIQSLEKVKKLLLLPDMDMATTKMVADFYEIPITSLNRVYISHQEELLSDGIESLKAKEVRKLKGKLMDEVELDDVGLGKFVSRTNLYPRKAILRVGMLLKESPIAKQVRSQILNIEEQAAPEQREAVLDEEEQLNLRVGRALMSGDAVEVAKAMAEQLAYKNRHVAKLEEQIAQLEQAKDMLKGTTDDYSPSQVARKLVNIYTNRTRTYQGVVWNLAYNDLYYKHGININSREGKGTKLSRLSDKEQRVLVSVLSAMCMDKGIDPTAALEKMTSPELAESEAMEEVVTKPKGKTRGRKTPTKTS